MKVIKIVEVSVNSITADNTEITADNIYLTADITLNELPVDNYMICITPRDMVDVVKLILTNELTKEVINQTVSVINSNGKMYITFIVENLKDGTTFRAVVNKEDNSLLWRGKVYATNQENIQNFKMNVPSTNNKIIM